MATKAKAKTKMASRPATKAAAKAPRTSAPKAKAATRTSSAAKPSATAAARKAVAVKPAGGDRRIAKPKAHAANNKTVVSAAPVAAYLAAIADPVRRADCEALVAIMSAATGCPPAMWGAGIVGFDSYHYVYDSGREGDMCVVGFSSRKGDISVYLTADFPGRDALLAKLGRHKMAKACLYLRTLADVDRAVLAKLVAGSVAERRRRHS
jgi:hypothetical protein